MLIPNLERVKGRVALCRSCLKRYAKRVKFAGSKQDEVIGVL
jgi:hypothetical protein